MPYSPFTYDKADGYMTVESSLDVRNKSVNKIDTNAPYSWGKQVGQSWRASTMDGFLVFNIADQGLSTTDYRRYISRMEFTRKHHKLVSFCHDITPLYQRTKYQQLFYYDGHGFLRQK